MGRHVTIVTRAGASDAIRRLGREDNMATVLLRFCNDRLEAHVAYNQEHGIDVPEVRDLDLAAVNAQP